MKIDRFQSHLAGMGDNVHIYDPITIIQADKIHIGNNVILSEYSSMAGGKGLYIGNHVHISHFVTILGGGYCLIEDFVTLAAGVRVITGSDGTSGDGIASSTVPPEYRSVSRSFVHCGRHAFIATNAILFPGVTIGEGAVVGAGSIVTHDLEPWSICWGSPAVKRKDRPSDKILALEKKLDTTPSDFSSFKMEMRDEL